MATIDDVFADLTALPRWVPYRIVFNPKRQKYDKLPHTGRHGLSTAAPDNWTTFTDAATVAQNNGLPGVGFVMTGGIEIAGWRLVGFDYDQVDFENFKPPFKTYSERSPSGTGVRAFAWVPAIWAAGFKDTTNAQPSKYCGHAEIYMGTSARFLTVTFDWITDKLLEIRQLQGDDLIQLEKWLKKADAVVEDPIIVATMPSDAGEKQDFAKYGLAPDQKLLVEGRGNIDRSNVLHGLLIKMLDAGTSREDVLATVLQTPALWQYCLDHRHDSVTKAAEFAREELDRAYDHSLAGKREKLLGFNRRVKKVVDPYPPQPSPEEKKTKEELAFPQELCDNAPGLVGKIARWVMQASYSPRKEFAYASALSMVAALIGPYCTHGSRGGKLNLYLTLVGETGSGKNEAIDVMAMLMAATEAKDTILDFPASEAALRRQLTVTPNILIRVDELAHKLESMQGNSNGTGMGRALLEAYNGGRMPPKVYADDRKCLPAVDNPYVQILGGTTNKIWDTLKTGHMEDGTLNRFMFVCLPDDAPYSRRMEPDSSIPKELKDELNAFWRDGKRFDLLGYVPPGFGRKITYDDDVREELAALDFNVWKWQQQEYGGLFTRITLHIQKIAGILAVGSGRLHVTMAEFEQAKKFVMWAVQNTFFRVQGHLANTPFERTTKRLLARLAKEGGKMSMRAAYKALHIPRREMEELTNTLMLSGEIEIFTEDAPASGGHPREWIVLIEEEDQED